jgi:hypothetical protein
MMERMAQKITTSQTRDGENGTKNLPRVRLVTERMAQKITTSQTRDGRQGVNLSQCLPNFFSPCPTFEILKSKMPPQVI